MPGVRNLQRTGSGETWTERKTIRLSFKKWIEVNTFISLGSMICTDDSISKAKAASDVHINNHKTESYMEKRFIGVMLKNNFPVKLYKTLVSYLILNGCKSWTLTKETERRI